MRGNPVAGLVEKLERRLAPYASLIASSSFSEPRLIACAKPGKDVRRSGLRDQASTIARPTPRISWALT